MNWPSPTKCARNVALTELGLNTIFIIAITVFILSSEVLSLNEHPFKDSQATQAPPWKSIEIRSHPNHGIGAKIKENSLGWRIHNQSRQHSQSWFEPEHAGWHPRIIDTSEFIEVESIQPGRLELVRHHHFGETPVLLKVADSHEAMIYRLLYDLGVTPSFLGHVTQGGMVIGFITDFVAKHEESPVLGSSSRREACLAALRLMHARGIAHRDAHGENCLLRDDGSAALIDFELSTETSSREYFDRDKWIMYHTIQD